MIRINENMYMLMSDLITKRWKSGSK